MAEIDMDGASHRRIRMLEQLVYASPLAIVAVDGRGRVFLWNAAAERLFGWRAHEVIGTPVPTVPGDRREEFEAVFRSSMRGELSGTVETRRRHKDGSLIDVSISPTTLRDEAGTIVGVMGIITDITDRKRAESALRHSEARYRELFENALDVAFTTDLTGRLTSINRAGERITGYTRQEACRMNIVDLAAPEDRDAVRAVIDLAPRVADPAAIRTLPSRYELRILTKGGHRIPLEVVIRVIHDPGGRPTGVQGIGRDMTERLHAEAALRESEERYRELFENANDIVYTHDLEGRITSVNTAGERVAGYPREEILGRNIRDVVAPGDVAVIQAMIARNLEGEPSTLYEIEVEAKDGRRVVLEADSRLVTREGRPVAIQGIARDITEWKHAREAIERSERYFRSLIENALDIIAILDGDLCFRYGSPSIERILGHRPADLEGRSVLELIHPDDVPRVTELARTGLRSPGSTPKVEARIRHEDGSWRVIEGIGENLLHDPAVRGIVINARDITDRKRAEQGLHRSLGVLRQTDQERRRLLAHLVNAQEEERARIAADIHDDTLQVMTAAGMRLEALKARIGDERARDDIERTYQTVSLAVQRLRNLLFQVRPPPLDHEGLPAALRMALNELRLDTGVEWDVRSSLTAEPPSALRTILYRIAVEALNNVRKHARASRVEVHLTEESGGVRMRIRDDGAGFAPERLNHKLPGHLGLVAMREQAELTGGRWRLQTSPGQGTTVDVWVPFSPGTNSVAS